MLHTLKRVLYLAHLLIFSFRKLPFHKIWNAGFMISSSLKSTGKRFQIFWVVMLVFVDILKQFVQKSRYVSGDWRVWEGRVWRRLTRRTTMDRCGSSPSHFQTPRATVLHHGCTTFWTESISYINTTDKVITMVVIYKIKSTRILY